MKTSVAIHKRGLPRAVFLEPFVSLRFVLLVILLALAGCATQQIGHDFDETKLSSFKPHQTTLNEVISTLGQPTERETESDGSIRLHYQWVQSGSGISAYVPVASMFHTSVHTEGKDAFLWFGPDQKFIRAEQNEMHSS